MRILYTSDWHLGRQFHNVSLLDDHRLDVIADRDGSRVKLFRP